MAELEPRSRPKARPIPAEAMAALFAGKSRDEQKALLAQLERAGAALYRQLAAGAESPEERSALLEAAEREEKNAQVLEQLKG